MFKAQRATHPHHHDPEYDLEVDRLASSSHWFVAVVSNPCRYKTRYALFRKFREHVLVDLGANLLVVECALGERGYQVTAGDGVLADVPHGRYKEVQVQNASQLWQKENLMNIGLGRLPRDAKYITFVDADISFTNPHIVTEIVHALQIHRVVQPFETCCDMGPSGQIINVHRSFGWCHAKGYEYRAASLRDLSGGTARHGFGLMGNPWHTGFCMSFRREVLDQMGGLLEVGALGSGDHHMFSCIIGKGGETCNRRLHPNYRAAVLAWQARAAQVIQGDLGYVQGTIMHNYHGPKAKRRYHSRWEILVKWQYDPLVDTTKNAQGVLELTTDKVGLRDDIRLYFSQRSEDSPELD